MCACVCVYARVYVVYVSVSVRERVCHWWCECVCVYVHACVCGVCVCVSVYVCMYVRVFDCDWCCATVFLCTGTIQDWRPSAVISRKTRMGWLQNAQKKLGGLAAGADTNWTYIYIHTHIYTHTYTHICIHIHMKLYTTHRHTQHTQHTHTHTHTNTPKMHTWYVKDDQFGMKPVFCNDKFVFHRRGDSYFLFVSTWYYFHERTTFLIRNPPFCDNKMIT